MHRPPPVAPVLPVALILFAGIALLGGCAQFDWHKADGTVEARDSNIAECTAEARFEALRRAPMLQPPGPQVTLDQRGRTVAVQPTRNDNERFLLEHDLMRACMHRRGYALVPRTAPTPAH